MDEQQEKPAQMILAYLRRNPGAGDTLEGIVRWWLGLERIESLAAEVAQVLGDLTRQGRVRAHRLANGTTFYTANDRASPPGSS
jgi:aryl-alcohol dehydrogenase-like predicted oxidoreductase